MSFTNVESIKAAGFTGFKTVEELRNNKSLIPKEQGVYLILHSNPIYTFIETGTGGFFKGRNPNVGIATLEENWIENTPVVYIGKATSLYKRLGQYFRFGEGKNVGHWGGRFIWQLENSKDLVVCWKTTEEEARNEEANLIQKFVKQYGKRPFANLVN
jgi:excinuclease UvrABC nuclease subunit